MNYRFVLQLDGATHDDTDFLDPIEIRTTEVRLEADEAREGSLGKIFDFAESQIEAKLVDEGLRAQSG